jgi:serine/threonine protein kinase, bacterial
MEETSYTPNLIQWCEAHGITNLIQIAKESTETIAWFASRFEQEVFLKLYPPEYVETRATIEIAIAGANLHPAIVPLRQTVYCQEGVLLIYDHVSGESLAPMRNRGRFQALPLDERIAAVTAIFSALTAIHEAGYMLVDWYEGNMIYDFSQKQIWLFDWELCRMGSGFILEMDSNYGSSRLMAPEEFIRGSWLDQQTLVFNLGRYALITLPELAESAAPILARATYPARSGRYQSLREFTQAFFNVLLQ